MPDLDVIPVVVVTGGSGYVATEICKQLLEGGYTVRATVRSTRKTEKVQHLLDLATALPGRLELLEADLLENGSFDEIISGSTYVMHCASPVVMSAEDHQRDIVDPAVIGTRNVFSSVAKASSVRRVVLTSSTAAIEACTSETQPPNGQFWTSDDWCSDATVEKDPYCVSKVQAEKLAWQMSKEHGFDLVVINPSLVLGTVISKRLDVLSTLTMKNVIENTADLDFVDLIDVRDVARAHILAAELPHAHGRYILSVDNIVPPQVVAEILSRHFPTCNFKAHKPSPVKRYADNSKVREELGISLAPPDVFLPAMARSLIQLGLARPVPKNT